MARDSFESSGKPKKERKISVQDIKNQLVKVANRYNEFLRSYKKFAKKNKHSLKEIIKIVFPDKNDQYHWGKRVVDQHEEFKIDKSELDDKKKIAEKWKKLSDRLVSYVPVSNTLKYAQIFDGINRRVGTTKDFETLMNEYNLPAKKILRYMQGVLARLNSTAAEGVVGRTLKAVTKGDKKTQEPKRNLEEELTNDEPVQDSASEIDTTKIFTSFRKVGESLGKDSEINFEQKNDLIKCFSEIKGFHGAIDETLRSSRLGIWGAENSGSKFRRSSMGVILISMAYLPGGSDSILNACDGLKQGGLKGTGNDFIVHASKVRKEIKKQALKGVTGDKLVNSLKSGNASESLKYFIDVSKTPEISGKFGKLVNIKASAVRKARRIGKAMKGKIGSLFGSKD